MNKRKAAHVDSAMTGSHAVLHCGQTDQVHQSDFVVEVGTGGHSNRDVIKAQVPGECDQIPKNIAHNRAERERTRRINDAVQRLRIAADTTATDKASILLAAAKRLEQLREMERRFSSGNVARSDVITSRRIRPKPEEVSDLVASPSNCNSTRSHIEMGCAGDGLPLLFDSICLGVAVLDMQSRLLAANTSFVGALKRERSTILGATPG